MSSIPARPDISVRYNPFHCNDDDYMPVVNMVFGSFNLHDEFFAKHQLNYLADIVRVLVYTGRSSISTMCWSWRSMSRY